MHAIIKQLAKELGLKESQVTSTVELIDQGNTIPFIARYRKEATGDLSDVTLRDLGDRLIYLRSLAARKDEVLRMVEELGQLTPELREAIEKAKILAEIEDLYRPFRPKKRTRAIIAREKGLEPLADRIQAQDTEDLEALAQTFISEEKGVATTADALQGAMDILAERISDNADYRKYIRKVTADLGKLRSEAKNKETESVYEQYYDYAEALKTLPPHRTLAINRGEREDFLKVKVLPPTEIILEWLAPQIIHAPAHPSAEYLKKAMTDSFSRLIEPAIERELRNDLSEKAEEQAIKVFGINLKNLLLQAPIKGKTVMGFDPAFRTGCKIAVMDPSGKLLAYDTVYPTAPENDVAGATKKLTAMIEKHHVDVIAIGNGTASRESELFVAELIRGLRRPVTYTIVNEAGASVYSASKEATEEYPDINVSIRGAISIAGRLQDPLAELVKIEPKAIGVGQYQHDVNQKRMDEVLGGVVEDAVNRVGVDVNTASAALLQHVAGINKTLAGNIVKHRDAHGAFKSRKELNKVPRLGPAAFTQAAGFLRIPEAKDLLDRTSVHPESYGVAKGLLSLLNCETPEEAEGRAALYGLEKLAKELDTGVPTLKDILAELKKPGRDPREDMPAPVFRSDVLKMEDLLPGMLLQGTVRNVIDFGAFVDIGVKQDGLVHISELSDKFVKNPMEVVAVGDVVDVKVLSIDVRKNRIALSMKGLKKPVIG